MLTFRADDALGVIHVRLFGDSLSFSTHGPVARYVQTRMNIRLFCDCSQLYYIRINAFVNRKRKNVREK